MISPISEILKKVVQMNLIYKIEIESQNAETKLMVTKEIKGGINWDTGIDIYILLYIK